jgi:UDP-N-acetylglucosamine 2-epimerase
LVGTDVDAIFSNVYELLTNDEPYQKMAFAHDPMAMVRLVKV